MGDTGDTGKPALLNRRREIYNKNTKSYYLPINNENIVKVNLKSKTIIADPLRGIVPNK